LRQHLRPSHLTTSTLAVLLDKVGAVLVTGPCRYKGLETSAALAAMVYEAVSKASFVDARSLRRANDLLRNAKLSRTAILSSAPWLLEVQRLAVRMTRPTRALHKVFQVPHTVLAKLEISLGLPLLFL